MSSVVFDCIDHVQSYLLVVGAWVATESKVFERRKLINHKDFSVFSIGKVCVTVASIDRHCLIVVARYLEAIHVDRLGAERMKLCLFGMAKDTLLCLCKFLGPM